MLIFQTLDGENGSLACVQISVCGYPAIGRIETKDKKKIRNVFRDVFIILALITVWH